MLTGQILLQLIVILLVVQLCGYLCKRLGQQWVIGEILAGLALGPSLLGMLQPHVEEFLFPTSALPTLQTLGDIGLILYMFSLGSRLDTNLMLRQSKKAVLISMSGILFPLILGAALAFSLFPEFGGVKATLVSFMLLVGTAMAITAFPVLARLLSEKNMLGTKIGTLALTCAAVDDVAAWCLLALVIAVVNGQNMLVVGSTVGLTVVFAVSMLLVVRPVLNFIDRHIHSEQVVAALSIVLLLLAAYVTNAIGIHPVFGAFLMGIILPRKAQFVKLVRNIDQVNMLLFLPLFFVYSGLRTQIGLINSPWLWLVCLLILAIACAGKIFGGTFAARVLGESLRDSFSLGILMNTRGLVELIVLNIGLNLGVLSPTLFAMLVMMALVTTMMASPLLPLLGYKGKPAQNQQQTQAVTEELPSRSSPS
ncbi:MAG TPA: cation:proton antiporter [Ktedonobacteraceae bacterium]|nr:cation:proton antiporter [Ktedonobacteraceae bacterium]